MEQSAKRPKFYTILRKPYAFPSFVGKLRFLKGNVRRIGSMIRASAVVIFLAGILLCGFHHADAQLNVFNLKEISIGSPMVDVDGTQFFAAFDRSTGTELWKTNGTANSTVLVKDIFPGKFNPAVANSEALRSSPRSLINYKGSLFFFASSVRVPGDDRSLELWKSDGTTDGTIKIMGFGPIRASRISKIVDVDGVMFFSVFNENTSSLYKSHGTKATTVRVKTIGSSSLLDFVSFNRKLFFTADDGVNGRELWISDGTSLGTAMVKDVNAVPSGSSITELTIVGNQLFFKANDAIHGTELWKSDGTGAGTVLVKDLNPGPKQTAISGLIRVKNSLFFKAHNSATGTELWKSDGTEIGTVLVKDINPGSASSNLRALTDVSGTLFFQSQSSTAEVELWKSDGTSAGTVIITTIPLSTFISSSSVNVNGQYFFSAQTTGNGRELWRSDGTEAGTNLVKDIRTGPDSSSPRDFSSINGVLYFEASSAVGSNNRRKDILFKTDPPICEPTFERGLLVPCFTQPSSSSGTIIGN